MSVDSLFPVSNTTDRQYNLYCNSLVTNVLAAGAIIGGTGNSNDYTLNWTGDNPGSAAPLTFLVRNSITPTLNITITISKRLNLVTLTIPEFVIASMNAGILPKMLVSDSPIVPSGYRPVYFTSTVQAIALSTSVADIFGVLSVDSSGFIRLGTGTSLTLNTDINTGFNTASDMCMSWETLE